MLPVQRPTCWQVEYIRLISWSHLLYTVKDNLFLSNTCYAIKQSERSDSEELIKNSLRSSTTETECSNDVIVIVDREQGHS